MKRTPVIPTVISAVLLALLAACAPAVMSAADRCVSPEDPAFLPDRALRGAIQGELGKQDVTCAELATLVRLQAANQDIRSLEGLQHATGLTVLGLQGNAVTDLSPLADLNLTMLLMGSNQITDLTPLNSMTSLETLALEFNEGVSDLSPLAGLPQLMFVAIPSTAVTDLSTLQELPALEVVTVGGFHDDYSVLTQLTGLTHLNAHEFPADQLHILSQLTGLTALSLVAPGGYSDVGFLAEMEQLEWLRLSLAADADVNDLASLTKLSELDLRYNYLTDITPLLALEQLTVLDVRDNCLPAAMSANTVAVELELRGVEVSYEPQRSEGC